MTYQWTIRPECELKVQNGHSRPENSKGSVQVQTDGLPERSGASPGTQCLLTAHVKNTRSISSLRTNWRVSVCDSARCTLTIATRLKIDRNRPLAYYTELLLVLQPGHTSQWLLLLCLITACVALRDWFGAAKNITETSSVTSITPKLH